MRVYLSGGMTGVDDYEATFEAEALRLEALGHEVISPARINAALPGRSYADCLRHDIALLLVACDAVAMLDGWRHSKGARVERAVALAIGLEVFAPGRLVAHHGESVRT
jgi:hypothetical protein